MQQTNINLFNFSCPFLQNFFSFLTVCPVLHLLAVESLSCICDILCKHADVRNAGLQARMNPMLPQTEDMADPGLKGAEGQSAIFTSSSFPLTLLKPLWANWRMGFTCRKLAEEMAMRAASHFPALCNFSS